LLASGAALTLPDEDRRAPLPRALRVSTCLSREEQPENLMIAVFSTIDMILGLYTWIIIGSAIFSWLFAFNVVNPNNRFVGAIGEFLYKATEPALKPIRRIMPDLGGLDISPIILLIAIFFIRTFIATSIAPMFF
jgi:YggT family protein